MPGDVFPRVAHNRRRLRKAAIWKMRSLSLVLVGSAAICASGFVAPVGKPAATTRGGRTVGAIFGMSEDTFIRLRHG